MAAAGFLFCASEIGFAAEPRRAAAVPTCPAAGTVDASFASATTGNSFRTTDGSEIVLAGTWSPDGTAAASSVRELAGRLANKRLTLATDGSDTSDRYGRLVRYVFADGIRVQDELLRAGLVLAAPDRASTACSAIFLGAENAARTERSGLWGTGAFAILTVNQINLDASRRAGTFQIVEGVVEAAAIVRGRAYLNFGIDRRTDFTVTVAPPDMRAFRAARIDMKTLAGKRVRVRGWLELYNGAELSLSTPGALEILEDR